jgi:hypothetical protein
MALSITNQTLTISLIEGAVTTVIRKDNLKVQAFGDVVRLTDYSGVIYEFLYTDCTSPSEASANALRDAINVFLITATGGGGGSGTVTSVAATVPSPTNPAFSVAVPNPTTTPSIDITANGIVSQYIRGDGSLANFPSSGGGGSSLNYYLNGSVSQGTLGGVAFKQMSSTPVIGAGTNFSISSDGYIESFITDASVPNQLLIPAGNWLFEMYFSASSGGGSPRFYIELYKLSGGTLSLIASSSANPEFITNGTQVDLYTTAVAVPSTVLLAADRIAVRVYVIHSGRTITLHTENSNLCEVITTFSTGITALNGLTAQIQNFATGTSGTDFGITSATDTHTFNLPTASAANRGALSSADWTTFNGKQTALTTTKSVKIVSDNVELDGDAASPGNNKVYGTDASGIKGFKSDPVNAALVTLYGAGFDGDVTISSNTTLVRDMYYNNLTILLGFTLNTNGFKVYVKGTLTNDGTIGTAGNNGTNGISFSSVGAGGATTAIAVSVTTPNGEIFINGGPAGTAGGAGSTGNGASSSAVAAASIYLGGLGGRGGTGGTGPSGTPGTGGLISSIYSSIDGKRYINAITESFWLGMYFPFCSISGSGGGAGAGGGAGTGGGSGGGGGSGCRGVNIHAFSLINSGTIRAIGGNGGNGSIATGLNAGGGAGGGGGGGGYMYLIYGSITNTGTITVAGGTGGLGIIGNGTGGTGANGSNGVAGTIVQINTTLGTLSQT